MSRPTDAKPVVRYVLLAASLGAWLGQAAGKEIPAASDAPAPPPDSTPIVRKFYTPEKIALGQKQVKETPWGKAILERIRNGDPTYYYIGAEYGHAERYSRQSDDFIWLLQPETTLPRVYPRDTLYVSPITGDKLKQQFGVMAWLIDPIDHPYQIQDRSSGQWFPKNDYLSYYRTGLNSTGRFDRAKADQTRLFNAEHPDGSDAQHHEMVDDGNGFEWNGRRYYALREYAKHVYSAVTIPLLRSFSLGYLLEDRTDYARKGVILLTRLAFVYPDYDDPIRKNWTYWAALGGAGREGQELGRTGGMITDNIWETFCLENAAYAYDALRPYIYQDAELIKYLKDKGVPINSAQDLDHYIRERLLKSGMRALLSGNILGNDGFHQTAAMALALILDDLSGPRPNSRDMLDFVMKGPKGADAVFSNNLHADGGGHESVNYNRIKLNFSRAAEDLEDFRALHPKEISLAEYPDFLQSDKGKAAFEFYKDSIVQERFFPAIGDCGKFLPPERVPSPMKLDANFLAYAWRKYHDPAFLQRQILDEGELPGQLFYPSPDTSIAQKFSKNDPVPAKPRLFDGYGMAMLEVGSDSVRHTAVLNYTSLRGHRQNDPLSLLFYSRYVDLLPDLGYPYGFWEERFSWDGNSLATNTVTVDETQPSFRNYSGIARAFSSGRDWALAAASMDPYAKGFWDEPFRSRPETKAVYGIPIDPEKARTAAQNVDLYERFDFLVKGSEESSYLVDVFSVRGGTQHDESWHSMQVRPESSKLDWKARAGTLAGVNVPLHARYTDRWGRERRDFASYLTNIREAAISEPATWTWNSGLPEGDTLKLHVIPIDQPLQAIEGTGKPPSRPAAWGLEYVLLRRNVKEGEASRFVTLVESYQKTPFIDSIEVTGTQPVQLLVHHRLGTDRITMDFDPRRQSRSTEPSANIFSWQREDSQGNTVRKVNWGGPSGTLLSKVEKLDFEKRRFAIEIDQDRPLPNKIWARIYNSQRSGLFPIKPAEREGNLQWFTVEQPISLARGMVDTIRHNAILMNKEIVFENGSVTDQASSDMVTYALPAWEGRDYLAGAVAQVGDFTTRLEGGGSDKRGTWLVWNGDEKAENIHAEDPVQIYAFGNGDQVEIQFAEETPAP